MNDTYKYPLALTQQFRFCGNPFRLDFYRGCDFGCKYCFANVRGGSVKHVYDCAPFDIIENFFIKAFETKDETKNITVELLRHKTPIHIGGMSDPFQSREFILKLNYKMIKLSNKYNYPLIFSTKVADLPDEYFEILNPKLHAFQISLFAYDNDFIKKYESNTPTPQERINFIKKLKSKGFWVSVRLQPLIDIEQAIKLCEAIDGIVNYITVEHLKIPNDNKEIKKLFEPIDKEKYYRPSSMRNLELKKEYKIENINKIKSVLKHTKIGCGDNDIHYLSDSNCCCGIDTINKNFDNYLKYNLTYFTTAKPETLNGIYYPINSVSSCFNSDTRIKGKKYFNEYTDTYCQKKNEFMCNGCPLKEYYQNLQEREE